MGVVRIRAGGNKRGSRAELMERAHQKASRLCEATQSTVLVVYGNDEAVLHFEGFKDAPEEKLGTPAES